MYSYIKGMVKSIRENHLIVDNNSIGYSINTSAPFSHTPHCFTQSFNLRLVANNFINRGRIFLYSVQATRENIIP
ncbi:MAG: hypothetical protein CVU93_02345 [Firmicutes bacterium HGW-Firmicutes-18]|nr:MAG: hypothetical protein CVU93_02345 [Firmicutes bacterium HGW-Firmicutes-18]